MSGESSEIYSQWVRPRFSQPLNVVMPFLRRKCCSHCSSVLLLLIVTLSVCLLVGCGSAGMPIVNPPPSLTNVVVVVTSTANDKLVDLRVTIASITLADQAGKQVTLYNNPSALNPGIPTGPGEFLHLNGRSEPLVTVSVPPGTYTMATVKVGSCQFTAVSVNSSGGLVDSTYAEGLCGQGTGDASVDIPSPITISGPVMAISLNMQVPQSYTLNGTGAPASYTIAPVFTLSPAAISSQPTNDQNGKFTGINAQITSVNAPANSFVAQTSDGISLTLNSGNNTLYQGVAGFSALTADMLVNLDMAIQRSDASLLAARVEVDDAAQPTLVNGLMLAPTNGGGFLILGIELENCAGSGDPGCSSGFQISSNTVFKISGQFSNLQNLPFTATFNNSNFFPGQNVSVFAHDLQTAVTITLSPQIINGTVTAVSSSNGFSIYTVALAPDDPIPTIQSQVGPITRSNSPSTVIVYADANAHLLNTSPISVGSLFRFQGLIFDDNGTLRMDCAQVNDGVPE